MFKKLLSPSLSAIALVASAYANAEAVRGTVVSVADGQTVTVLANGRQTTVMLAHIKAPARCDLYAEEAQQSLAALALGKDVIVDIPTGSGKGRRAIAVVRLQDGTNLSVEQVARGMALAHGNRNTELAAAEGKARLAQSGVWSTTGTALRTTATRCDSAPHPVVHPVVRRDRLPVADGSDGTVPKATTDRVLGNIRDFAGGQPSPNIVYSTRAVGEAANAPGKSDSRTGPVVSVIDPPPPYRPLAPSKLRTNTINPEPMQSPWGSR